MQYIKDNQTVTPNAGVIKVGNKTIINPTEEQLIELGFEPYEPPTPEPYEPTYNELVVEEIRKEYSIDDELAILRQKESKIEEFERYNSFCESVKSKIKRKE